MILWVLGLYHPEAMILQSDYRPTSGRAASGIRISPGSSAFGTYNNLAGIDQRVDFNATTPAAGATYTFNTASVPAAAANFNGTIVGYSADGFDTALADSATAVAYGFKSDVSSTGTSAEAYNFYAEGNAPNYFAGPLQLDATWLNVSNGNPTAIPSNQ